MPLPSPAYYMYFEFTAACFVTAHTYIAATAAAAIRHKIEQLIPFVVRVVKAAPANILRPSKLTLDDGWVMIWLNVGAPWIYVHMWIRSECAISRSR